MDYLMLKLIHILSSTILFGTGLGTAFFMVRANISNDIQTLKTTTKSVVLADWVFTTPAVIIQPFTGFLLMKSLNYSFDSLWFYLVVGLYLLTGACWIPVVYIQSKLKDLAQATQNWDNLSEAYFRLYKTWLTLGVPAFVSVLIIFYLMIYKPYL
ncbi:MAG: DUF2269 domain-containing protein [Gammaproteobacteria bacterium]|nr:DUF2269 domain-containing protein [Gammaproteobacteria bacterium]